jgi:hypothetical protein
MDHRSDVFKKKFGEAARHLGVKPARIISLKFRENVSSYAEYREVLRMLEQEFGIQWREIEADLQGRGYLLSDGTARVLMVEHESGLEILYIAGSIASLIGLVPLVVQGWRGLRGWSAQRHDSGVRDIEIRRLDESGELSEHHVRDMPTTTGIPYKLFISTAKIVEDDLHRIMDQLQSLTGRVEGLEKQIGLRTKKSKARNVKNGAAKR